MIEFTKDELYEIERLADQAAAQHNAHFKNAAHLFFMTNTKDDITHIPICVRLVRGMEEDKIAEDLMISIRKKCEAERGSEIKRKKQ